MTPSLIDIRSQTQWDLSSLRQHAETALWAIVLGLVSGLACVAVRIAFRLLQLALVGHTGLLPEAAAQLSPMHRSGVPVIGALVATLVVSAARRRSCAAPFREYVVAIRSEDGIIPFQSTLWRTLSSAFSVATGAAVGREGSMIQFATAVTSWFGLRWGQRTIVLPRQVAFGAAAAIAAAYQAPVAAIFFGFEIVMGKWAWDDVPGLTLASTAGWAVSRVLLGHGPLFPVQGRISASGLLWVAPLCLALGMLAPLYQKMFRAASRLRELPAPLLWAGAVVGLLGLAQPAVWGNGDAALLTTLSGKPALIGLLTLLFLRLIATTVCVGTGTVGGVFTPTLFTGATLGLLGAHLTHIVHPELLILVGLSAFLAAVTHAPWMAGFMATELTGQWEIVPLLLLLNLLAVEVAKHISAQSLYGIASPDPEHLTLVNKPQPHAAIQEYSHEQLARAQ